MAFTESRSRIAQAAAKVETTYGVDPTIGGATDGFNTIDSAIAWNAEISRTEFRPHGPSFTRGKDVLGTRLANISFTFLLQGSGTAGTAVQGVSAVLQCCGLTETLSGGVSSTYAPSTIAALKSSAIKLAHTTVKQALGCYGNARITATSGQAARVAFTGRGIYAVPSLGVIASWAVGATGVNRAVAFLGISATINNGTDTWITPTVVSFSHDLGNDIRQIPDALSATGLKKLLFADRNPTCEIVYVLDTETTGAVIQADEFYVNWTASTTHDIQIVHGATAGNINTFNADTAQLINVQEGEGDGFRTLVSTYKLQHATAEAEHSWVQT